MLTCIGASVANKTNQCGILLTKLLFQFNIAYGGYYKDQHLRGQLTGAGTKIVLKCFASGPDGHYSNVKAPDTPDGVVARAALPPLMRKLEVVGNKPPRLLQKLMKWLTLMPFDPDSTEEIDAYIRAYAESHLLTEQVGAGGGATLTILCQTPSVHNPTCM